MGNCPAAQLPTRDYFVHKSLLKRNEDLLNLSQTLANRGVGYTIPKHFMYLVITTAL